MSWTDEEYEEANPDWIDRAIKHPGALRARLGISGRRRIPESVLREAKRSKDRTLAREATLAETLRQLRRL
jgi:hypothetical protein